MPAYQLFRLAAKEEGISRAGGNDGIESANEDVDEVVVADAMSSNREIKRGIRASRDRMKDGEKWGPQFVAATSCMPFSHKGLVEAACRDLDVSAPEHATTPA